MVLNFPNRVAVQGRRALSRAVNRRRPRVGGPPARRGLTPRLILVVRLEVLLHVVGARELLMATRVGALHALLGCVDLGVSRRVARRRKGFLAAVAIAEAARVALRRALRRRG